MARRFHLLVTGEPGSAGRQLALHDPDALADNDGAGGLYIGADPQCDIVLDEPGAEAWHARLLGQGHHLYVEVIAGRVTVGGVENVAGERRRLGSTPIEIGQVRIEYDCQPREDLVTTLLTPRTRVPEPLDAIARRLLVRVRDLRGGVEVLDLGDAVRLREGIVIGSHLACDVLVSGEGVHPHHVRLIEKKRLCAEVLAGVVQLPSLQRPEGETIWPGSFELAPAPWQRWRRLRVGRFEIQLCRWPARGEAVQPRAPRRLPTPPASEPRPVKLDGPRAAPPGLDPARCLAALIACIRTRPRRDFRPPLLANAVVADPDVAALLRAWSEHAVAPIRVGDLRLSDADRNASLPSFEKGELVGEVDADHGEPRTDLLVLGRFANDAYLALVYRGGVLDSAPLAVDVAAGTETMTSSFGEVLRDELARAWGRGEATDLDPFLG